jgi:hypothetical protein
MKVVINSCFGGFGLSIKALLWIYESGYRGEEFVVPADKYYGQDTEAGNISGRYVEDLKEFKKLIGDGKKDSMFLTVFTEDGKNVLSYRDLDRDNPVLVKCVETLGEDASGECSSLKVVEIPDGIEWEIDEYDGRESISESHRSWC